MRRLKEEARKKKPELKLKTMVGKDEHTAATAATRWNPITGERYGHGSARPTNFSKRDNDDDDNYEDDSNDDCVQKKGRGRGNGRWTIEERNAIIRGMALYGKDYAKLSTLVPRSRKAVNHYVVAHSLSSKSKICKERKDLGAVNREWTEEERNAIIRGMALYGKDDTKISTLVLKLSTLVPTRNENAIRRYIEKHSLSNMIREESEEPSDDDGNTSDNGDNDGSAHNIEVEEEVEVEEEEVEEEEDDDDSDDDMREELLLTGTWSIDEQKKCAESLIEHGSSYESMAKFMKTRTAAQVKSYYSAHKKKLLRMRCTLKYENELLRYSKKNGEVTESDDVDAEERMDDESDQKRPTTATVMVELESKNEIENYDESLLSREDRRILVRGITQYGRDYKKLVALMDTHSCATFVRYCRDHWKRLKIECMDYRKTISGGPWSLEERERLYKGIARFGKDYDKLAAYVGTRGSRSVLEYVDQNNWGTLEQESVKYKKQTSHEVFEDMIEKEEFSRHHWTRGEQEKLSMAFSLYGKDYGKLSRFMKYRKYDEIKLYMQSKKVYKKIKEISKKYGAGTIGKETVHTNNTRSDAYLALTDEEHGNLCEAVAIYDNDYKLIEDYLRTNRSAEEIEYMLSKNAAEFKDDSEFDLASPLIFPIHLRHVLNIAPHVGFDHIISWNYTDERCVSFTIHDAGT